jgi:hypothetical protein
MVGLFNINLGDTGIVLHYVQRVVTQQGLEGKKVAPGTQIGDGEGMAKSMRMNLFHPGLPADLHEHMSKAVAVHKPSVAADKKRRIGLFSILAGRQIAPKNSLDRLPKEHHPPFTPLGTALNAVFDLHLAGMHVHIPHLQGTQLRSPQSGIQKHQNDRPVPRSRKSPHRELAAVVRIGLLAEIAMLKKQLYLVLGEWLKWFLFELGGRHKFHGVGKFEFQARLGEESPKAYLDVTNGFGGKRGCITVKSSRFVFGPQPDEKGPEVFSCYFIDLFIPRSVEPLLHIIRITSQCCGT